VSATQPHYSTRVYDQFGVLLRVLSRVQSARYKLAENEVGDFDVTVPWDESALPVLLSPPNRVEFWRDSTYVFGGIIRRQNVTQEGNTPFYTCGGPSYMQFLADARVRPSTGTGDVVFAADNLDDTMKAIVRTHVLDNNTQFSVPSDSSLSIVSEAYTATGYATVLETLQGIATRAGDTTFDIVRDDDGALRFRTWTPSRGPDKSLGPQTPKPVVFDLRSGGLLNAEWTRDGSQVVNALWGGGPGDKAARYIWPATEALTNSDSINDWGRIEGFLDSGNESTADVQKKVIEELAKQSAAQESVTFKIAGLGQYTLGVDFDFGTKVTVLWPPILTFSDTIQGIEVRLDGNSGVAQVDINVGDTITGDAQTRASIALGRFMRTLRRNISIQTRH
jgi:hypothetical protein